MRKTLFFNVVLILLTLLSSNAYSAVITGFGDPISAPALAGGTVINFDSGPVGDYSSLTLQNVTFTDLDYTFRIGSDYIGNYNTRGTYSLYNGPYDTTMTNRFRFDFITLPVDAFGFNWGASDYSWLLSAFDSTNNLLDTFSIAPTTGSNAGDYFGIASSNIAYATLVNQSGNNGDWVFIDNFTSKSINPIPEPGTMMLLGTGLLGMIGYGKVRFGKKA